MTSQERAKAIFDTWHDNKAGTELPKLDRESLIACFTSALLQAKREGLEEAAIALASRYENAFEYSIFIEEHLAWLRQHALREGQAVSASPAAP